MNELGCFRCGGLDHWAHACPLITIASSQEEHMGRIQSFIDRWVGGAMTLQQKRVAISLENTLWYGDKCPKHLTYP